MTSTRSASSRRDSTVTRPAARGAGARRSSAPRPWLRRPQVWVALGVVAAVTALFVIFTSASGGSSDEGSQGNYEVGSPASGEQAPDFTLDSATGGTVSLSDYRGQNVLLYFQEGLMCQPCWTQITDLEKVSDEVRAAGVDEIVSITTDPVDLLGQKVADEGFTETPVLSDPDLAVSNQYGTTGYGMMGGSRNGHSFVLVGPDGQIRWRADYGGEPDYTMYVPTDQLLADLRDGLGNA